MSEDEHDRAGNRPSPLESNGGIYTDAAASAFVDVTRAEPGSDDGGEVYDGRPRFDPPPGPGRVFDIGKRAGQRHPPLACPNPRFAASARGFYRCGGCGAKIRLAGYRTASESADEFVQRWMPALFNGIAQVWYIIVSIYYVIEWAIRWVWWRLHRADVEPGEAEQVEQDAKTGYDLQGSIDDQREFMTHDRAECRGNCFRHAVPDQAERGNNADVERRAEGESPGSAEKGEGEDVEEMEEAQAPTQEVDGYIKAGG